MPAFIFLSGNLVKYSKHKLNLISKLLIPYVIFQIAHYLLDIYIKNQTLDLQFTTPDWTLWFLMSLITWYIITPYFVRLKYPLLISIILALVVSYDKTFGPYLSTRMVVFYPFYLLGYYLNKDQILYIRRKKIPMILFSLISIGVIVLLFTRYANFDDNWLFGRHPYEKLNISLQFAWVNV